MPSNTNRDTNRFNDHIDSVHDVSNNVVQGDAACRAQGISDRYVVEDVAADILGMSKAWLRRTRWSGEYPDLEYVKYGNAVRYSLASLYAFAQSRTVNKSKNK
jgi:hypothetical protein